MFQRYMSNLLMRRQWDCFHMHEVTQGLICIQDFMSVQKHQRFYYISLIQVPLKYELSMERNIRHNTVALFATKFLPGQHAL